MVVGEAGVTTGVLYGISFFFLSPFLRKKKREKESQQETELGQGLKKPGTQGWRPVQCGKASV